MNIAKLDPELLALELIGDDERGYDFLDETDIAALKRLTAEGGVLSLYLDIRAGTQRERPAMTVYRQGIDAIREAHEKDWPHEQRVRFDALAKDVGERLEALLKNPRGKGIALFAAPHRVLPKKGKVDYQRIAAYSLPDAPVDQVAWGGAPVLGPLLMQRDEHPDTGVALFDRTRVRFFLYTMGEAAEYSLNLVNPERAASGKTHAWHGYGEHNHQNWQQEHYRRYLRQAAVAVEKIAQKAGWKALVVASPDAGEAGHLLDFLSRPMRERVIGTMALPMDANLNQVRDAVAPLVARAEAEQEKALLESWVGELAKPDGRAVAGLADTVLAAQEYALRTLIVDGGFQPKGWQCDDCGGLVADLQETPPAECPYCAGGRLAERPDIVADLALQVIHAGGDIEVVCADENRETVNQHGRIGGLLRY